MRPVTFAPGWANYADVYSDPTYEKVRFFAEADGSPADGKCRVDILPDGRVTLNDTLPSILSLTSITFRVE